MKTRYAPFGRGGGVFGLLIAAVKQRFPMQVTILTSREITSMTGTRVKLLYILQP